MDNSTPFPAGPGGPGGPGGSNLPGSPWQPSRHGDGDDAPAKKGKKGKKKTDGPTRRVLSANRTAALVLGVAALALLLLFGGGTPDETTFVVRTARPLSALSPITAADLQVSELPTDAVEEDAFSGGTADEAMAAFDAAVADAGADGARLQYPVGKGAQVAPRMLLLTNQLSVELAPDERLVSIEAGVRQAVGGDLRVGDRVDIVAVLESSGLSRLLVPQAEVVDVTLSQQQIDALVNEQTDVDNRDKTASELLPGAPIPGIYTLRIPAGLSSPLLAAQGANDAHLFLVYAGPGAEPLPTTSVGLLELMCGVVDGRLTVDEDELPLPCLDFADRELADAGRGTSSGNGGFDDFDSGDTGSDAPSGETVPDDSGTDG